MVSRKMRMLAASLALVLCVSLYSVPRAKAVATEVAVGTAAVASYFQATGLTMAASAGSTGALITTGVADIAGSYAMATGAASSGSAFLSSLAAGVSISPAGAIVLTAAAVVAVGALVTWYIHENGLEVAGDSAVPLPGSFDFGAYNGVTLPNIDNVWTDKEKYPFAFWGVYPSGIYCLYLCNGTWYFNTKVGDMYAQKPHGYAKYLFYPETGNFIFDSEYSYNFVSAYSDTTPIWSSFDLNDAYGTLFLAASASVPVDVSNRLEITRAPEFVQPDQTIESDSLKQMVIDVGFAPGATLDTVATEVPELIAAGTLTPTYEITTTEPDTGTDTEPEEDQVYIPMLEKIHTTLNNLGSSIADKIMTGLQSLFVPDEAFFAEAMPELQQTFQGRMGLLTFPISLLADFLGRLLELGERPPILSWNSVSIYGTELIAAGSYDLRDALKSAPVNQMYTIYMIVVNAALIFAFLGLCHNKYRKIMQN